MAATFVSKLGSFAGRLDFVTLSPVSRKAAGDQGFEAGSVPFGQMRNKAYNAKHVQHVSTPLCISPSKIRLFKLHWPRIVDQCRQCVTRSATETADSKKTSSDDLPDCLERGNLPSSVAGRRSVLATSAWTALAAVLAGCADPFPLLPARAFEFVKIDFSKQPSGTFDPSDQRLRDAAATFQRALDASTVEEEERLWTEIIDKYGELDAVWVPDILSRAWGNRGNARSRQGRLEQALGDFSRSIELAPYAVDPVLNRGVALENLGRYEEAAQDYCAVLQVSPADPAAWNNLGNVRAALGQWDEALLDYRRAVQLAPEFSFAAANYALALYQLGRDNEAIKQFRTLLRRYPEFPDMRAALAVSLYKEGLTGEAETNWVRLEDPRYRDRKWVRNTRRWPPRLADALEAFLDVKPA